MEWGCGWKLPSLVKAKNTRVGSPTRVGDVILVRRRKDPGPAHVRVADGHERYCTGVLARAPADPVRARVRVAETKDTDMLPRAPADPGRASVRVADTKETDMLAHAPAGKSGLARF